MAAKKGPHAVLYVLKLDRYTPEEYSTYQKLKEVFDADIVKYIIIVFTGGDRLKNETLDDILENAGPTFRKVAEECGNRVIIFNNLDKKKNKETQVKKLLEMTQKVVRENGENPYRCTVQEKVGDKLEETVTNSVKSLVEKDPKLKEFFSQIEAMLRQSQNRADSHKAKLDETIKRKKEVEATEQKMREEMEREKREREEEERKEKERKEAEEQEKKRQEEEAREKARKEEEEKKEKERKEEEERKEKERKEEEERKEKERKEEEARREKERKEEEARRERQRKEEEKQKREEELRHQKELLELERKKKQLELEAKKEEEKFRKEMREKEELERKRREEMDEVHRLEMERKKKDVVENKDTHWTLEAAGALWKGAKGWLGF
nr:hypothetical protein BaRGS_013347 [Batillaria attramentaria]